MWFESHLPEAPSEGCKIRGFLAGPDDDEQPAYYRLPIADASADSFADVDDCISWTTTGMWSKKVSKLLPCPDICSWCFYWFEGEEVVKFRSLNPHVMELAGMCSFENLAMTDVVLSSSEAEDVEAAVRSIIEASSWLNWWTFTVKSMALRFSQEVRMLKQLCIAGARCQLLVEKTVSTVWVNLVLKWRDAVIMKVKDSISFESFMDLWNLQWPGSSELFPTEAVEKAVEKLLSVLHDEAIRKTVSTEKSAFKSS